MSNQMSKGGDVHVITGMHRILNPSTIKPGTDPREIEQMLINGGIIKRAKPVQERFEDDLRNIVKGYGIVDEPPQTTHEYADDLPPDMHVGSSAPPFSGAEERYASPFSGTEEQYPHSQPRSELSIVTREQERRSHIDAVMDDIGANANFSFENEKREDEKYQMLEEIDSLIISLKRDDIDLTRIPNVDRNSKYEEVEGVLRILRFKSDRRRYSSLANEFLLFGAHALEDLFDGERVWFGRCQPDLTGWHNEVQVKLRRMDHDTSTLMSSVMADYHIGPGARILMELIPNAFLYSKARKKQQGQPALFNDIDEREMLAANERIRDVGKPIVH